MSEPITIRILARHYKDSVFVNDYSPIDRAVVDHFGPGTICYDMVWDIKVNGVMYTHEHFGVREYFEDKREAELAGFDESLIREIVLIEKKSQGSTINKVNPDQVRMKPAYKPGKR